MGTEAGRSDRRNPMRIHPRRVRLEAATVCQLKCPACATASGKVGQALTSGFLRFEDFKRFVDENPRVSDIELSNWGEIFLNPDLLDIITYADEQHVLLRADNGVNLNTVREEVLEALVRHRFHSMTCSIDGASQQTYALYRKRGSFDQVIEHIRRINEHKVRYRSAFPLLRWQFVAFGHNEHEAQAARRMANALRMSFCVKLSWDETLSPVKDQELIRRESGLGAASREEFREKYGEPYRGRTICAQLWRQPQINFDGRVLGCCVNYWGDFGNAFTDGLVESVNNEKINYARQMLLGHAAGRADIPCTTCRYYQSMKEDNAWVRQGDVKGAWGRSRLANRVRKKIHQILGPAGTQMWIRAHHVCSPRILRMRLRGRLRNPARERRMPPIPGSTS